MSLRDFNSPSEDRPIALNNEPLGNGSGLGHFHTVNPEEREPNNTPKILAGLVVALMVGAAGAYIYSVTPSSSPAKPMVADNRLPSPPLPAAPAPQPAADTTATPAPMPEATPATAPAPEAATPVPVKTATPPPTEPPKEEKSSEAFGVSDRDAAEDEDTDARRAALTLLCVAAEEEEEDDVVRISSGIVTGNTHGRASSNVFVVVAVVG